MKTNSLLRIFLLLPALLLLNVAPGLAQSVTRLEQNDSSVTYSGNWYSNEGPAHSGGSAALTNTRGSRVAITFTGTGITWIGMTDAWSGLANVYVDGNLKILDTYSAESHYQNAMWTVRGLTPGTHTMSIEVLHERGPGTDGSWVWVDAFDVENGTGVPGGIAASTGHVEENNPALVYTGPWYSNLSSAHSGGSAVLATDVGARASVTFNGTGISWTAHRDEWSGVARVYLDGDLKTEIDNYLSPQANTVIYSVGGLPSGPHTLTIEVTGTHNASSHGAWIWVDAFDVVQ